MNNIVTNYLKSDDNITLEVKKSANASSRRHFTMSSIQQPSELTSLALAKSKELNLFTLKIGFDAIIEANDSIEGSSRKFKEGKAILREVTTYCNLSWLRSHIGINSINSQAKLVDALTLAHNLLTTILFIIEYMPSSWEQPAKPEIELVSLKVTSNFSTATYTLDGEEFRIVGLFSSQRTFRASDNIEQWGKGIVHKICKHVATCFTNGTNPIGVIS